MLDLVNVTPAEARISCGPRREGADSARNEPAESARPAPIDRPHGRVLVVDDEANARTALADLLRDEGYSVETAADGFKALHKLEEFAPDLILTDLKMPGMDGITLMKKAQQTEPETAAV